VVLQSGGGLELRAQDVSPLSEGGYGFYIVLQEGVKNVHIKIWRHGLERIDRCLSD
jgi:hypothetical protein